MNTQYFHSRPAKRHYKRTRTLLFCSVLLLSCTDTFDNESSFGNLNTVQPHENSQPTIVKLPNQLVNSRIADSVVSEIVLQVQVQLLEPVEAIPATVEAVALGQWSVNFTVPENRVFSVSLDWLWQGIPIAKTSRAFPMLTLDSTLQFDMSSAILDSAFDQDEDGVTNIDELNNGSNPLINESTAVTETEPTENDNLTASENLTSQNNNSDAADNDGDGITDNQDNCPNNANTDQTDSNQNGIGDACETSTGNLNTGSEFITIGGQAPWRNGVTWPTVNEGDVVDFTFTVQESGGGSVFLDSIELWAIDSTNSAGNIFDYPSGTSVAPNAFLLRKWLNITFSPASVQVFNHSMVINEESGFFSEGRNTNSDGHRHDIAMISRDRFNVERYKVLISPPTEDDGSGSRTGTNLYVQYESSQEEQESSVGKVTSVSPANLEVGKATDITVTGINIPQNLEIYLDGANGLCEIKSRNIIPTNGAEQLNISCYPLSAGTKELHIVEEFANELDGSPILINVYSPTVTLNGIWQAADSLTTSANEPASFNYSLNFNDTSVIYSERVQIDTACGVLVAEQSMRASYTLDNNQLTVTIEENTAGSLDNCLTQNEEYYSVELGAYSSGQTLTFTYQTTGTEALLSDRCNFTHNGICAYSSREYVRL